MLKSGVIILLAVLLTACGLPQLKDKNVSHALLTQDTRETRLGRSLEPQIREHPGMSGVVPLFDAMGAFSARMLLVAEAQRTLDIQYYIWRDDITGNLLLQALREAAKRQVRVRLLLDDNGVSGLDNKLALLNAEPNVEVRLFNPFPFRAFKPLGFLTDFSRVNRRMHNKSFTVDGQVTIVGGRNVGDEYFGATQGIAFADLDVLVAGEVVDEVSQDFDNYWNSTSAYPLESLVSLPSARKKKSLLQGEVDAALLPKAQTYVRVVRESDFFRKLIERELAFQWGPVRMVSDDPGKVLDKAPPETLMLARLVQVLGKPVQSVDLVSPYFVPTEKGAEALGVLADQGVKLRILTNAMEATDVTAVHAGYAKYRVPLMQRGIELFEMRAQAEPDHVREKAGPFGSSGSSLHAKTFAVDGKRVFVGSFNFDPRSAMLNTELGFVIESKEMAQSMAKSFDDMVPMYAYRLGLDEKDKIYWLKRNPDGTEEKLFSEPSVSFFQRLYVKFLSVLPIESLL